MKISTTKNNTAIQKILKVVISVVFWLLIWELLCGFISGDLKVLIPSPAAVIEALVKMCATSKFYQSVFLSILRILIGFVSGVAAGILFGIITSEMRIFDTLLSPAFKVIRSVPVVSFIILAYLFIDDESLPIFISFLMVLPLVWQETHDSLVSAVPKLCEMGKVFGLNRFKILYKIKLPSVYGTLVSVSVNALGFAWKSGIAAEVIHSPQISIGKSLLKAKNSINFDEFYALTLTVVILSIIFEITFRYLCRRHLLRREKQNVKN